MAGVGEGSAEVAEPSSFWRLVCVRVAIGLSTLGGRSRRGEAHREPGPSILEPLRATGRVFAATVSPDTVTPYARRGCNPTPRDCDDRANVRLYSVAIAVILRSSLLSAA